MCVLGIEFIISSFSLVHFLLYFFYIILFCYAGFCQSKIVVNFVAIIASGISLVVAVVEFV